MILQKLKLISLSLVIAIIPFYVLADGGDDHDHIDDVDSSTITEIQTLDLDVASQTLITEEPPATPSGIGDGHTDHAHAPITQIPWWKNTTWWIFFITSLISMAVLSFGVDKYLKKGD